VIMNRQEFKSIYSSARQSKRAARIEHNGRKWTVTRGDCQRLDSSGCYDRIGRLALCLNHASDARRRMGLKGAARGLISLARELRA
jgi:hypothetical protein